MIGKNQVCSLCYSEEATKGCICDRKIILIGKQCYYDHLNVEYVDHNIVDLELAFKMQKDPSLINFYMKELPDILNALTLLRSQSMRVKDIRTELSKDKERLFYKVEEIFNQLTTIIEKSDLEIYNKIKLLSQYKSCLGDEGRSLMDIYRAKGLEGMIESNIEKIEIPVDDLENYVKNSIFIYYSTVDDHTNSRGYTLPEKRRLIELEKGHRFSDLEDIILQKDQRIKELEIIVNEKDSQIISQNYLIADKDQEIRDLKRKLKENEVYIHETKKSYVELQSNFKQQIDILEELLKNIDTMKTLTSNIKVYKEDIKNYYSKSSFIRNNEYYIREREKCLDDTSLKLEQLINESLKLKVSLNSSIRLFFSGKRYIYVPTFDSTLIQYDIQTERVEFIKFPILSNVYIYNSSCELPNGDVFLISFRDINNSKAYLYKVVTQECIILPFLKYPRYLISLYYYRDYVFAFGGTNSNIAERYSLSNGSWETLPNMKYERDCISCVGVNDKIYLFSGGYNSIEVFDTNTLEFQEIQYDNSDTNASGYGVAFRVDDRVYLLTDNLTQVYDTSLNKISQFTNTYKNRHYTIHNIVQYKEYIYYYNYDLYNIEKIDINFTILEPQPYSNTTNRYIYKLRNSTKNFHRLDLEYNTIESIDLSTTLNRSFDCTSLCVTDNGEVVIAGFDDPVSGECYLYSPSNNSCTRLPDLITPRCSPTLIYHNNYVYAFGGRDSLGRLMKVAERMYALSKDSWTLLSDMKYPRLRSGCVHKVMYAAMKIE
jgi:hypothetical protein